MRTVGTLALALGLASAALADEPRKTLEPVLKEQVAADKAATASQSRVNELSEETRAALLQYRQYLEETKSLEKYAAQLGAQVKSQEEELAFTQQQLVEIETTTREVLPLMEKMLATLDAFVTLDVPFQLDERRKRVDGLKAMMGRADVTVSEKYRRIIEAYQIETDYGRTLETYQAELGDGEGARTVRFLRLGRVALLYQTLDAEETGYWDAQQKKWVVDDSYRNAVKKGFAVADKAGAPDLLEAPVPAPVAATNGSES
jgi:hypothetical protein